MKLNRCVLLILLLCNLCSGCVSIKSSPQAERPNIEKALQDFKHQSALQPYFEQAKAIVIIPHNVRAGTGFGGAMGKGWLLEGNHITADVWHWQFLAGVDLGFQLYQQILFLKDENAIAYFKSEPFQFAGQANATAIIWGKGWNPSYNEGVALFTIIDGGLLLEGSVGLHSYHVFQR
jgi:lipid-binding SYLF domain-containing protein